MENITKGIAPSRSHFYPSSTNVQLKHDMKDLKGMFEYKEKYDQSCAKVGLDRPAMGSSGWDEQQTFEEGPAEKLHSLNISLLAQKPLVNLLHVPGVEERGLLTRYLYYTYMTLSRDTSHSYPSIHSMKKRVLEDEKLHHAIQSTVFSTQSEQLRQGNFISDQKLEKQLRRKAVVLLDEMIATVTSKALKFCGWLFLTLLRQLTSSVHLHEGQLEVIRSLSKENKPIMYFPLHFSHFDYILLSLSLYHNEIQSPFVASGNNLLIQPFSAIMRRVGGFFIRRKIDNGLKKDLIYRSILHSYVTELLRNNQSIEIFLEGTRTRSGLPNLPKTGLLSVAVEALERGDIPDVVIVPVCMSYEKVLEGCFHDELMGRTKRPETFLFSVASIVKMLFGFYGHIRVNFGVPQSLKRTLHELRTSPTCSFSVATAALPRSKSLYDQVITDAGSALQSTKSSSSPSVESSTIDTSQHLHKLSSPSSAPLIGGDNAKEDTETRELVSLLGERIIYCSVKCKVYMSTNLVAFLLLHRWRSGVCMPELVDSFRQLTLELFSRKCDVGFSGDFYIVVIHAVNLLGGQLVDLDCSYPNKIRRSESCASIRSKRSADSGYDLEEGSPLTKFTSNRIPSPLHVHGVDSSMEEVSSLSDKTQSGSDSGEEMSWCEQEEIKTGQFMSVSQLGCNMSEHLTLAPSTGTVSMQTSNFSTLHSAKNVKNDVCLNMKPVLDVPQVFDLTYYANALTPLFALESVVGLAVGACIQVRFSTLEKQLQVLCAHAKDSHIHMNRGDLPPDIHQSFLRSTLFDKALELVDILQMDLIFCDVTKNLESAVSEAIDKVISNGYLSSEQYGTNSANKSIAVQELCFDDDEHVADEWLKVNLVSVPALITMQSIMAAFVEGYVAASTRLPLLLQEPLTRETLQREMLTSAQLRVSIGLAVRNESSSSDIIRNALRSFEWNGIIVRQELEKDVFQLTEDFSDVESVGNLISRISQFLF